MTFGDLLAILIGITWFGTGVLSLIGGILYLIGSWQERWEDVATAIIGIVIGLGLLLSFGAVVTGEFSFNRPADGCYHVYEAGTGKSRHTEYDPIPCPWVQQ